MANLEWTWSTPCLYEPFQEKMSKIIQTVGLKKRAEGMQSQFQPIGVYDDYMCRKEHDLIIHNKEKLDSVAEDLEELAVLTKHIINGIRLIFKAMICRNINNLAMRKDNLFCRSKPEDFLNTSSKN